MLRAHAASPPPACGRAEPAGADGWQMKIFPRLPDTVMPVIASGPRICSAWAAWMRSCPPSSADVRVRSSLSAKLRCTNVIASLCCPAVA
ncbi:hypothetical protein D3C83_05780 [compost metagenome]